MLVTYLVAEVIFLVVSGLFAVAYPEFGKAAQPGGVLLAVVVVPTVLAALVAAGVTALTSPGPRAGRVRRELALRWSWRDLGIGAAAGVAGLVLTIPAAQLWKQWVGPHDANSAVGQLFSGLQLAPGMAVGVFFAVWLVAPVCEEVLYRGVLWRAFEHWRWNRWIIAIVTSVVFAFAHFEPQRAPLLLVISIPIALARLLSDNLLGSIVAHQINNLLPAIGLLLALLGALPV